MPVDFYKKNKAFLFPYIGFLLIVLYILILWPKSEIHLFINRYHTPFFDFFFRYMTFLGSGVTPVIIVCVFLLISFRKAFLLAASTSLAGLLVQVLKRLFFYNAVRPLAYFKGIAELHLVSGVNMYYSHSFPSGHSATIFALCFTIALFTQNNPVKIALFILAVIVAFSRVYLSQHFLMDIYVGSIVGIVSVPSMKILFDRIQTGWIDKSASKLLKRIKKKSG
jgi:membrane-associated phospholipid phosphatase